MNRLALLLIAAILLFLSRGAAFAQTQLAKSSLPAQPEPAVAAILSAFDHYEVVAMPAAHGIKDVDDLIFSLLRNPAFPEKVNDIEMECGNSLYQPILDRYIAGDDVSFTEVQKVWRNTTQPMCGLSGFVEQFYPLVRAINQKLPPAKRLRVLAADPPIDWSQIKTPQDFFKFADRESSIGTVMEKEVLSKHRKALLLCGTFHLLHGTRNAVSFYEKDYPNVTFVISDLSVNSTDPLVNSTVAAWPFPSIIKANGSTLGALDISHFFPAPTRIDQNCTVHTTFPEALQKPMARLVDAFLYLGPPALMLQEQLPADIALDTGYINQLRSRGPLLIAEQEPATLQDFYQLVLKKAEDPFFTPPKAPDPKLIEGAVNDCKERLKSGTPNR